MKAKIKTQTTETIEIQDGFYKNFLSIIKIQGDKYLSVSLINEEDFRYCLTTHIKIGNSSSLFVQEEGLVPATEEEFRDTLAQISVQIDRIL